MHGWHIEKLFNKTPTIAKNQKPSVNERKNLTEKTASVTLLKTANHHQSDTIEKTESTFSGIKKDFAFERGINLTEKKDFEKKPGIINQVIKKVSLKNQDKVSNNGLHLLIVYSLLILGLALLALVITSLINAWGIAVLLFLAGVFCLALSIAASISFLNDIREEKSSDIKWPYKIIIAFGAMILSLLITGILILMLYLIIFDPPILTIVLSASICFIVCMIILLSPLLSD
ncbi:MAG: hypothetical protein IT236_02285 [Bacteroidia bacterium]|nr:hypothetical protein [Bacteroidia bacterium]